MVKKDKNGGLESVKNPRFQFVGFNQNFFLINLVKNMNHFDGFLPRFLVATPDEVYTNLEEKINAANESDEIDMKTILKNIFEHFFRDGLSFQLSERGMKVFAEYHD